MINVARTIVEDFVDSLPGGTSDEVHASSEYDSAGVRIWFDGAWYQVIVAQIADPGLPLPVDPR